MKTRMSVSFAGSALLGVMVLASDAPAPEEPPYCPYGGPDASGFCCASNETLVGDICVLTVTGQRPPGHASPPPGNNGGGTGGDAGGEDNGGGGGGCTSTGGCGSAGDENDPPTAQENADELAKCIVDNLSTEDKAGVTPHSVTILKRPRVGGEDVDGYAGCVEGKRYISYIKERVAKRGGASLRELLAHEIAHHLSTDMETCDSYDGREHGAAFGAAFDRTLSAAEGCG